ncbi:hypothetical protein BXU11_00815 [Flavobacterium sp. LM5]|nr:hypothetical protein BXU11_00815 [Flavobacterium sp. LM5]
MPSNADDITLISSNVVVVNINLAVCKSLNISGTLTIGNNDTNRRLTVSGNVIINGGGVLQTAGNGGNTLLIGGNLVNDGTFDMNVGNADAEVTFNGGTTQTISGAGATMDFNSITLTNAFPLVINRGITVDGDWINNGKSVSGSGLVTFTGNSIIGGPSVTAFPNLTITGTVLQGVNTTVSGNFTINSGTYRVNNATNYTLTIGGNYNQTGGVFDFNAGTSGTSNVYLAGNLTNSAGSGSISTVGVVKNGILTFNGSGIQILNMPTAGAAIWAKYVVNTGSTLKLASNFTLNRDDAATQSDWVGELTVNGTLDCATFQVSQSGGTTGVAKVNLNAGAILITANPSGIDGSVSSTNITRTFSTTANYNFNGSVAQTTSAGMPGTVNSLTLSNTSGVTLSKATTVTTAFSIASNAIANLGTFTHTAGSLFLGGFTTSSGSWGSTTSSATNKNNTYFAATTGIVNVGSSTCTLPTVYTMTGSGNLCAGSAGNLIGLSNSEIGVSYQLVRNSVNVGSVIAGTGSSISFGLQNSVGNYTVIATRNNTFCSFAMTGVVTIYIASLPPLPVGATIVDASCSAAIGSITLANQNHALELVKTSSQYISTASSFLSNLASFTLEGWIKYRTSDLNTSGFTSLFGQNDVLEFGFQGSQLHLYTLNGGNIYATPPVNLGDNTWHHIAAVGTGSQILIYVDGVVVGSGGNATSNYGSSADNVKIGAGVFNSSGDFFGGQIMKAGLYNTALSTTRIASLAYSPITYTGSESGLIAGYNFQQGSGTTLASLPAGKNGTLVNTPVWRDPYTYAWTKTGTPAYTASTRNITGLSSGEYNLNFDIGKGCSRSISYTIGTKSTTWNGISWTPSLPTIDYNLEFTGDYTSTGSLNGCSCTVTSGNVLIKDGHTLNITNAVNVTNSATTSLIFENNASLVQTNNVTNSGAIEYRRKSSKMKNFDFTYWSSPVYGDGIVVPKQTAKNLSPNTLENKYFRFDPTPTTGWVFDDGEMKPGVGFIIRVPKPGTTYPNGENWNTPTYEQPVTFKGIPNNGDINYTNVGPDQFHLIGNPYPSALDATKFLTHPNNESINFGAIYFWTHNTAIDNGQYKANDYATFNITGGTATGPPTGPAPNPGLNNNTPSGFIAAGQSFFIGTKDTAPNNSRFEFRNSMRVASNNTQFFKQENTKKTTAIEKNRVWLNLTNSQGAFKQLLVGYIAGATNDFDNLYDGPTFDGQPFVDFYSINQGKKLTIQGRALPFEATDEVPLGYRSTIAGPFEISIDARDGNLDQQEIWLEDKKTATVHDLTKGCYTFTTINGVENDRFVLKYTNKTLGTDENTSADKSLVISIKNKKITVTSSEETITQIQIFDLLGRKIYDKSKINTQEYMIEALPSSEQTLIVKTTLANGAISSKKIIL